MTEHTWTYLNTVTKENPENIQSRETPFEFC